RDWRGIVEAGLGDARTRVLGVFLILVAVIGTLLLRSYANIETVFAASLLAGSLLGRWWTILVPLTALAVLQPLEWSTTYTGYGLNAITGITFFVISVYVFVGFLGRRIRPRVMFRVKSVALLMTISVPVTSAFQLSTEGLQAEPFPLGGLVLALDVGGRGADLLPLPDEGFPLFREGPGNERFDRLLLAGDPFPLGLEVLPDRLRLRPLTGHSGGLVPQLFLPLIERLRPRLELRGCGLELSFL